MATRKALVLVSGLFQELNSSADKLDFAGNSTSDLSEGTNQYFTNARARGAVSVASGNGLTYNSSTGVLGTSAIPNSQLANDDITIGSTAVALGATQGTFTGLTSLASTTLISGIADAANAITIASGQIVFEGATANDFETTLAVTDPTADRTITFPDAGGTIALTSDISYPVTASNTVTFTNKTIALGSNTVSGTLAQFNTAVTDATLATTTGTETLTNKSVNLANNTLTGTFTQFNTAVSNATLVSTTGTETLTNKSLTAPVLTGSSTSAGSIIFKEDTDNGTNSATLKGPASTADVTITLPAETGTVLTTASSIANSNLANSSLTIGSTGIALGGSATTFTGLASITSTAVVTNDSGFRIRNNSDNTKIGAFSSASITGGQTRTLTFPDADGTIATQAYVNAQITAEDLDVTGDSGSIAIDLDSEALNIEGGTNITTAATGNKVTINMPTAFATESFADVDFRIEGDTEANLFYVDAGNNRVGIGTSTPEQIFHIHGSNNGAILSLLRLTNAGGSANTEARIEFELGSLFTGYIGQTHDSGDAGSLVFGNKSSAGAAPTEKMRINKSGNMAIGIISPAARLHIYGNGHYVTTDSGKATNGIHVRGAGGNSGEFGGAISFSCGDANSSSAIAAVQNSNDSDVTGLSFFTHDSTDGAADAAERMRIDSSGNIGIGTTSPDRTIHCHNSSNTTNVRAKFSNGTTGEGASDGFEIGINGSDPAQAVLVNYENSPMAFFTNGSERMRIGSSGRLFVGTTSTSLGSSGVFGEFCLRGGTEGAGIHLADNDANVHGGLFTSDISNAMFIRTITNHPMVFRTNNTERMRIHSSGIVTMTSTPAFQAKGLSNAASSSATTNANEFLVFSTVNLNQGGDYDNSNGRFTAPVDGMYFFTCMMLVDNSANTDANYLFSLTKNGSTSTFIRLEAKDKSK